MPTKTDAPATDAPQLPDGAQVFPCADQCGRQVLVTKQQLAVNGGTTDWFLPEHAPKDQPNALTASEYINPSAADSQKQQTGARPPSLH